MNTLLLLLALVVRVAVSERYSSLQSNLSVATKLWSESSTGTYVYHIDHNCFCPECYLELRKVKVEHSSVLSVSYVKEKAKDKCKKSTPLTPSDDSTIDKLLSDIQSAIDNDVYSLSASFHAELGYPTRMSMTESDEISDSYSEYTVHCLTLQSSVSTAPTKYHDKCVAHDNTRLGGLSIWAMSAIVMAVGVFFFAVLVAYKFDKQRWIQPAELRVVDDTDGGVDDEPPTTAMARVGVGDAGGHGRVTLYAKMDGDDESDS